MNELLVVSFIFLNIFSSYPTSFNLVSRSFKTIIRLFQNILTIFFVKQVKFIVYLYCVSIQDSLFFGKALELWFLWFQMAIHIIPQCLLFYFSRFMKRPQEVVESINKDVYTFHPYIDRLCKTNPYTNKKCLFHLRRSVYGNIYTVDGFPWSFDMTSRCLNWQLESLWWLPGLIGDIGKNCWLMGVIKNDKN